MPERISWYIYRCRHPNSMEKFNEELIRKELLNLSKEAIDETIRRLKEDKKFKFSDEDTDSDGTNFLEVKVTIRNYHDDEIGSTFNDFYTKKQLESVPERTEKEIIDKANKIPGSILCPGLDGKKLWEPTGATTLTAPFNQQELKLLLDMIVSLMLYIKSSNSPVDQKIKDIYKKILEMF